MNGPNGETFGSEGVLSVFGRCVVRPLWRLGRFKYRTQEMQDHLSLCIVLMHML
jgi:hypothetical protein